MWSVSAIRIIQDDMETIILSLRKFSLRLVMIITFAISFLTGFFSLINGESLGITAILSVIGIVFFYITFAVHAIENEQKALRTAYLFVAAYAITLIGSFSSFKESPNFSTMIVEDIITGDNSIEEWTNRTVASSAPYTILMNIFMLTGLFYPLQSINKRFNASWRLAIAAQLCSTISVLSILIANNFNIFSIFINISGVLSFILIAILFFKGGKTESTHGNIISLQTPTPSPQVHNDISSKSEELTKLKSLLDAGVLTQEEFDIEKKKILNS